MKKLSEIAKEKWESAQLIRSHEPESLKLTWTKIDLTTDTIFKVCREKDELDTFQEEAKAKLEREGWKLVNTYNMMDMIFINFQRRVG
jgi:hypothetical protein